jgi:hypothetical protein
MTLNLSNLSVLAYANNFTLWHYKTHQESITTSNYFYPAANIMNVGDMIIANIGNNGASTTSLYIVSTATEDAVVVKPF